MSRDPDRQTAEIQIRIAIMNRFSPLGRAESIAVHGRKVGKGVVMPEAALRNTARPHNKFQKRNSSEICI